MEKSEMEKKNLEKIIDMLAKANENLLLLLKHRDEEIVQLLTPIDFKIKEANK